MIFEGAYARTVLDQPSIHQAAAQPSATSITGRIVFSDGMPASGLVVQAVPVSEIQDPGLFIKGSSLGRTDGAGAYKIQLAAGSYYLRIRDGRGGFTYYPGVPVLPDAAVVRTTDTPIENLDFALPEAASGIHVSGHVTLPPSQSGRRAGHGGTTQRADGTLDCRDRSRWRL